MVLKLKPISLSNRGYILEWFIPAKFRQDLQQHALSQPLNLQSLWPENFIQTSLTIEKKKKSMKMLVFITMTVILDYISPNELSCVIQLPNYGALESFSLLSLMKLSLKLLNYNQAKLNFLPSVLQSLRPSSLSIWTFTLSSTFSWKEIRSIWFIPGCISLVYHAILKHPH